MKQLKPDKMAVVKETANIRGIENYPTSATSTAVFLRQLFLSDSYFHLDEDELSEVMYLLSSECAARQTSGKNTEK